MDAFDQTQHIAQHIASSSRVVVAPHSRGARLLLENPDDSDLIDFEEDDDVQQLEPVPEILTSDDLEPIQTPWSPLGVGEHEFSNMHTTPGYSPETSPTPWTGTGTFQFSYDITPSSTTWEDFMRGFWQQALAHELPERISVEGRGRPLLTVWISAKVVEEERGLFGGRKRKERVVVLEREGWREGVRRVLEGGVREVWVRYCLMDGEGRVGVEGREREREVGRRRLGQGEGEGSRARAM
ncbi:hypothetical protein M409DRAFT_21579 [Zasmidium cellare ATCC 36951]|uniref:Uncharacterized protein n=1 Tax=Zasmidium cellare ATCC 36951 TaxID=1080233 RepID=A0A6A6CNB7_ZASCE|nr:uncharacterized protein M409DRAFT_21579 [Zasmidium cellare ATCC 36951]KAF2168133.1 hypothetical protein M409DRAFT_21579 [Zasmidium cellare ATCC 36951]